ncbi:hypothetical protein Gpo141_00015189, partial [Globisporangium polare]
VVTNRKPQPLKLTLKALELNGAATKRKGFVKICLVTNRKPTKHKRSEGTVVRLVAGAL